MADKPTAYTAEVAERLQALVMDLKDDVYKLEDASRVTLALAMGLDDRSQIPDDLIEDGLNFIAADLVRCTMAHGVEAALRRAIRARGEAGAAGERPGLPEAEGAARAQAEAQSRGADGVAFPGAEKIGQGPSFEAALFVVL